MEGDKMREVKLLPETGICGNCTIEQRKECFPDGKGCNLASNFFELFGFGFWRCWVADGRLIDKNDYIVITPTPIPNSYVFCY